MLLAEFKIKFNFACYLVTKEIYTLKYIKPSAWALLIKIYIITRGISSRNESSLLSRAMGFVRGKRI
jgi:hypothetical protein